ncbi:MAG: alpha/beta hydrolase [Vulcanimicrobiaceae bacterium]
MVFSHHSGGHRRTATFLCTHLSSHGYVVAALDHSEVVAAELARKDGESAEQKAARMEAWIANRVPDVRFLLDHLLDRAAWDSGANLDPAQVGIVGQFRRLDSTCCTCRGVAYPSRGGARTGRKFPAEAGDSSGEAYVQLGSRRSDTVPGRRGRHFAAASRHVRTIRTDSGVKTHGHLAPVRPSALHGQCRARARDRAGNAVRRGAGLDSERDAADRGTLFRRTGQRICAWAHALPPGCNIEATGRSAAFLVR